MEQPKHQGAPMRRTILAFVSAVIFSLFLLQVPFVQAQTETTDELISLVGKAIVEETTQASEEVKKAKEILDVVLKDGTLEEQEQAQKDVEEAEGNYAARVKKLDTARTDAIAAQCGKSSAEIQAMRNSGMGWGKIAKECGIHPSTSGKGNAKGKNKSKSKDKKK